jgi:hypothetical protein
MTKTVAGLDKYLAFCCTDAAKPRLFFFALFTYYFIMSKIASRGLRLTSFTVTRSGR